ncbi:CDK-activating kinase assembly factor MAT1 [Bagarius yarrelli]|uniref:CDK-activating kinase assembly factor MAT1 n=1 Tax=Bagarius yarrelli TaxID=175774 RepID=A0A556V426_BAGYA|nr:CDK-activating kinase assembly factor MAT1 [Bagarius yarrelli]
MDDQSCPRCKTTKYRNPSLKLMVNVCGHTLEQEELEELLLMEQQDMEMKRLENLQEEQRNLHTKRKNKQALLDELGQTVSLAPVVQMEEVLYQYHPLQIKTYGPVVPELEQLARLGPLSLVLAFVACVRGVDADDAPLTEHWAYPNRQSGGLGGWSATKYKGKRDVDRGGYVL